MTARLRNDVACSIAGVRLAAGTVVTVIDTTEGEFRDGLRRYAVVAPWRLVVRVRETDLEVLSNEV